MFGFMTRGEVAAYLGVSESRVRQLVASGDIAPPIEFSARMMLFREADIKAEGRNAQTSGIASMLGVPSTTPQLTHDVLWDLPLSNSNRKFPFHIRIYEGPDRIVVLFSEPRESGVLVGINRVEDVVDRILERFLPETDGARVTWINLIADAQSATQGRQPKTELDNVILTSARPRQAGEPKLIRKRQWVDPKWSPMTWEDLNRVLGNAKLDVWDWRFYNEETIHAFQRTGQPVPVVHDALGEEKRLADTWIRLDRYALDPATLAAARYVLSVALVLWRSSALQSHGNRDAAEAGSGEPHVNTTIRVPYEIPESILGDLNPNTIDQTGSLEDLLRNVALLRAWLESVDQYSEHFEQEQCEDAERCLTAASTAHVLISGGTPLQPARELTFLRHFDLGVDDKWNRRFLEQVLWEDDACQDTFSAPHSSSAQSDGKLSARERRQFELYDNPDPRFGRHTSGAAVAHDRRQNGRGKDLGSFQVLWPSHYDQCLPSDTYVVADGGAGDSAAYLMRFNEIVGLLPTKDFNQWNFGYAGGGPGALASTVVEFLEDRGIAVSPRDRAWVEREVVASSQDSLSLSLASFAPRKEQ